MLGLLHYPLKSQKILQICKRFFRKRFLLRSNYSLTKLFGENPFQLYHSDNGGEFISALVEAAIVAMGGKIVHGRPRHPQSQGQVERLNGTLKRKIKSLMAHSTDGNWSTYLKAATTNYNNTQHSTIKMAPYKAEFGKDCVDHLPPQYARLKELLNKPESLEEIDEILRERIKKNAEDMARKFNRR